MKELGIYLVKIAAFCLVGVGAAVAYIFMPTLEYATEARSLEYQFEESTGLVPSEENCTAEVAKDNLAECKTALYMVSQFNRLEFLINVPMNILLISGAFFLISGSFLYVRAILSERRTESEQSTTSAAEHQG